MSVGVFVLISFLYEGEAQSLDLLYKVVECGVVEHCYQHVAVYGYIARCSLGERLWGVLVDVGAEFLWQPAVLVHHHVVVVEPVDAVLACNLIAVFLGYGRGVAGIVKECYCFSHADYIRVCLYVINNRFLHYRCVSSNRLCRLNYSLLGAASCKQEGTKEKV